jgi:repressor LexA
MLTRRQEELQSFIGRFLQDRGYPPTIAEIQTALGVSSTATVHGLLSNLEKAGVIKRVSNKSRAIELVIPYQPNNESEIPLAGKVAAGYPIEAILTHETITVPSEMVHGKRAFALQVSGDSMIEDGIFDNDLIVVESRQTAESGQTVVALVNENEATVKRFYKKRGQIRLEPANPRYKPIIIEPPQSVNIQGIVVGLIRRF